MSARLDLGLQALKEAPVLATKIGGENACEFQTNLKRATERESRGQTQFIIFSALRTKAFNTTDKLLELISCLQSGEQALTRIKLEEIEAFHHRIIDEKVEDASREPLHDVIAHKFSEFSAVIEQLLANPEELLQIQNIGVDWIYTNSDGNHFSLTGFGEDVCKNLYDSYFSINGLHPTRLPKEEMVSAIYTEGPSKAHSEKRRTQERMRGVFKNAVGQVLRSGKSPAVIEGHQAGTALQRSYSDNTTAEMARAASELGPRTLMNEEKKTRIRSGDGLKGTVGIELMSRDMLGELTGARGAAAKVIQGSVVGILKDSHVDIVVHDPDHPEEGSTFIPWNAGLEVDEKEIVTGRELKTVLHFEGGMQDKKGVLAAITSLLRTQNIDQTVSTRNTVTVTLDGSLDDATVDGLQSSLRSTFDDSFTVTKPQNDMALVFCLGGSQREHPSDTKTSKVHMANRVAEPPFAARVIEGGEEGVSIPYVLTVKGPMSDASGVLAVITDSLRDYNIDQTFSTETTWTVTLDERVSTGDIVRLYDALNNSFGNGWTFDPHTNYRVVAQTENFDEHPLWNLLQSSGIKVHYMHAIPERGVTVMMVPKNQLADAEQILHNQFYGA